MEEYLTLIAAALLVNNFVLTRFLGICPFLGVSQHLYNAAGMAGAVIFVQTLACGVTGAINQFILVPAGLEYMQTIAFILVIASLVQLVEIFLQRFSPPLYKALGIYLPLITTNCAIMGAAVLCADRSYTAVKATVFGFSAALGFALALALIASLRERLDLAQVPRCFSGTPIALITAGILAMAFMGFAGLGAG